MLGQFYDNGYKALALDVTIVCSYLEERILRAYAVTAHELYVGNLRRRCLGLVLGGLGLGELADVCQRVEKRGAGCDVGHGP